MEWELCHKLMFVQVFIKRRYFTPGAGFALAGFTLTLGAFFFLFMKSWILKLLALVPLFQAVSCLFPINGQHIDIPAAFVHFFIALWFYVLDYFMGKPTSIKVKP